MSYELLVIPYMAITSGWSGGSLWGHKLFPFTWMPEVLFSLPFAFALYPLVGWWCVLASAWSYIWMQTGHANALPWGDGGHNPDRENTLSPLVKWLADRFGVEYYSKNYARLFMGVKGFLITLPVGGVLGFVLWPLGYEIGNRSGKHVVSETLSGGLVGVSVVLFMKYIVS